MSTALFSHRACLDHDTGFGHPECADRLRAVLRSLEAERFQLLDRVEAPRASRAQLIRIHAPAYVDGVLARMPRTVETPPVHLDADTIVSYGSHEAALRAAGAVVAAVDAVLGGANRSAFCAVRPPGHHAEPDQAMGFCIFNNAAIGAAHARAVYGLRRVAVIDFDVHHGNGTQAAFAADPDLFYGSTHQSPLYPGTGAACEHGIADNIVNVPLAAGAAGDAFAAAYGDHILPALDRFAPELILVSAGFDGHALDPLAGLRLREGDFVWLTTELAGLARRHCRGGLVSTLEGGYDLAALAASASAHVATLMAA